MLIELACKLLPLLQTLLRLLYFQTVFADLELGFNSTNSEDDQVFYDFAFIEMDGKNKIVFVSGTENRAAIVDISNGANNVKTSYVKLGDGEVGYRRQVEWAVGTPYVWIDGDDNSEVYVIDTMSEKLVTTLVGIRTTRMLSVRNYAKMHEDKLQQEAIKAAIEAQMEIQQKQMADEQKEMADEQNPMVGQQKENKKESEETKTQLDAVSAANVKLNVATDYEDDDDIDIVGILGLIIGACALIVGTMNVFVMSNMKSQIAANKGDLVSLGSKDVA